MDELEQKRAEIDKIDSEIQTLLTKRFSIIEKISEIKAKKQITILDKEREKDILNKIKEPSIKNIFKEILKESKKAQASFDQ